MAADNAIILITLIQLAIAFSGLIFNLAIVWITIKNKNLQNSYGYLLAIYSFCEVLLESTTFLPTILTLIDTKIPLPTCFYVSVFPAIWGANNAAFSLLFISFDRMLAMIFPIFYRKVIKNGTGKFVLGLNLLSTAYIFTMLYFDLLYALENRQIMVYCQPGDQIGGALLTWGLSNTMTAYMVTIILYIILGIYIKFSRSKDNQMAQNRRIYKTLANVMCVIFFLYFMGCFLPQFITPLLTNDPQMSFIYFHLFTQLITVAGASNAPVLYFCSTEYRNTMNQQFPFIHSIFKLCRMVPLNNGTNHQIVLSSAANIIQPALKSLTQPIAVQNRTFQMQSRY